MHKTSDCFWDYLNKLPEPMQKLAAKNFALLKANPHHPSLQFKKTGKFWSARVGLDYRALSIKDGNDFIWVWIGSHADYERVINQ
ncbi:MAG TPA: hypothetical protein DCZ94_03995 [Lentisphaeria bacterium]|nr:MAG: hypothetical protein A2X48_05215 [Lentisphaerae bacterium GWF2_49_21]HBC86097.1 hypothetical protein [Lentisphaeria bacterium]